MAEKHTHYETNPITILITGVKRAFAASQQLAIMLIVLPMLLGLVSFVGQIFMSVFQAAIDADEKSGVFMAVSSILFILLILLSIFTQNLFIGFQAFAMHKISRGEDEQPGKALEQAFAKFWKITVLYLMLYIYTLPYTLALTAVTVLAVALGVQSTTALVLSLPVAIAVGVFLIVLIVRIYLRFAFAGFYLFDGAHSVTSALEKSKTLTKGRLLEVFGIMTIGSFVPFISSLVMTAGLAELYQQLTVARAAKATLPKQHMLNYLIPAIVFVLLLFMILMFAAFITAIG